MPENMPGRINPEHITIVLNQPRYPENIGSGARAMRNMGFYNLIVVDPENFDLEKVEKLSTHAARDVVEKIQIFDNLQKALSPFNYVVGTTARLGGQRQVNSPSVMAEKLIPISKENNIAIVFGREDRGLSNEDIRLCHGLVNIPTADFSSLNLAQAVMVICYELFNAGTKKKHDFNPRLASCYELNGMYKDLKDVLIKISYINPENPDYWMNYIRKFFTRMNLRAREVGIIRGLIRQVNWYGQKMYKDGLDHKKNQEADL
ncbi:tRNA (cytidine/uridine-2'-O-)-methyltransferase [Desulfonema limicola]|uniref:tRNA (cytidine/uridine-2'-O-)-methyltransferase TrmJ n=1 Tax=Desulfonema limicola TaxID=45656 RepID=A0A975BDU5_9BACT|nr:RNA methyltransferase [Desulfonema limicola]QTA83692.1 tRNA (cytidine/uridine-2'-O-)-methyltransferase [Desulfonema limicola]